MARKMVGSKAGSMEIQLVVKLEWLKAVSMAEYWVGYLAD